MKEIHSGVKNCGRGLEFYARRYLSGTVLKKTYYPLFDRTDIFLGKRMKDRMQQDLSLIEKYFGKELVEGSQVIEKFGKWYIRQPDYGNNILSCKSVDLEHLKPQIFHLLRKNDEMVHKTGYTLDVVGFDFWKQLPMYIDNPDYWAMNSFRVTGGNNNREIKLIDTGLLWTRPEPPSSHPHVNFHEYFAGSKTVGLVIPTIKKRTGFDG